MKNLLAVTNWIIKITKWAGLSMIVFMMFFITMGVILRQLGSPLLGSVEMVRLMMVTVIACSLSYCESQKGHIVVELFFDKFPELVQKAILLLSNIISLILILIISIVYYQVFYNNALGGGRTTDTIGIPFYPFELLIAIGFTAWFIQILVSMVIKERNEG